MGAMMTYEVIINYADDNANDNAGKMKYGVAL